MNLAQSEIVQRTPWRKRKSGLILPDREGAVWCAPPAGVSIPLIRIGRPSALATLIAAGKISLCFDAAIGITKDGSDFVSNWENTGTGTDATQATGALKPHWAANEINGLPAVEWQLAASPTKMPGTMAQQTACTIIAVIKQDTTHDGFIVDLEPTNAATNQGVSFGAFAVGSVNFIRGITSDASKAEALGVWELLSGSATDSLRRIWRNQVLGTNSATGVTIGLCDNFQLGSDVQYGIYFDGKIAQLIVSNVELTDPERIAVEDKMQLKFAL